MYVNKANLYFVIFLAVYILTACSPVIPATSTATRSTSEIRPLATITPKAENTPTPTTQVYSDNLTRECVKIISQPSLNAQLTGLLMINPDELGTLTYLLDLSTGNKILLGRSASYDSAVSEDGRLVAYWDLDKNSVVIADNYGNKLKTVPDADERLTPIQWLDDQRLMLNYRRGERNGPYVVSSIIILDISTGKTQEWLPDYPNLDTEFSPVNWSLSRFLPNPQLTYLVYQGPSGGLIMWDINAKKEIARVSGDHSYDVPWWSPDGTKIVTWAVPKLYDNLPYVSGGDLYMVDTSGNMKRLTYFTTTQGAVERSPAWSPDGKAIAFMLQTAPDSKGPLDAPELSVLDTQTGQVTNLCIQAGSFTWSPDGKYILVNQGLNEQKKQDEVYIVDLANKLAWKVVENAAGEGWMVTGK